MEQLRSLPDGPEQQPLLSYLRGFRNPEAVAREVLTLMDLDDPYVAPPDQFYADPGDYRFETWEYYVNARSIHESDEGRLLCLPPGSNRFQTYRDVAPTIINDQIETNFPHLQTELANRPNLLFPGVFYPQEINLLNMEMISLHHGTNYVVRADLDLEGREQPQTVVLKPAPMGVEAIVTSMLDELNRRMPAELRGDVGPIRVPSIVSVGDRYGILEYVSGDNGVELLPDGIQTGSIHRLKANEYPDELDLSRQGLLDLAGEFAKQAAVAYYLRQYDRKPDQMLFHARGNGRYEVTHIDFGRAVKKNFALPWKRYYATDRAPLLFEDHQIPYFEAAACMIFLPHFIPRELAGDVPAYEGVLRDRMEDAFVRLATFFRNNHHVIEQHLQYLVGEKTQFDPKEVENQNIQPEDVEEVSRALRSLEPSPEDVFQTALNLCRRERDGTTPTESVEPDGDLYRRLARPGGARRRLASTATEPHPYRLLDYKRGGSIEYDRNNQVLTLRSGTQPQTVLDRLEEYYSPQLAEFIRSFGTLPAGVVVKVLPDGRSEVRYPEGGVRKDIQFPEDALREVRQVAGGFAAPAHVREFIEQFHRRRRVEPDADLMEQETERQTIVFDYELEGREILQCYQKTLDTDRSREAFQEVIDQILSNDDYLADKDPYKSINNLVAGAAHKYGFLRPLGAEDEPDGHDLGDLYGRVFQLYNEELPTEHFPDQPSHHILHARCMLKLGEYYGDRMDITGARRSLLRAAILLHDLNLLDAEFCQLLSEPNGRLDRRILETYLKQHNLLTVENLRQLQDDGRLPLPGSLDNETLRDLLEHHHRPDHLTDQNDRLPQILHVVDTLAVFADQTRPAHWNRGYLRFRDLGPQWLHAQRDRDLIDEPVHRIGQELFEDGAEDMIREIDQEAGLFSVFHNGVELAGSLNQGLDPQNPGLLEELRRRHGATTVDRIWNRVLRSFLPVEDKLRLIRRMDDLAPLFERHELEEYAFINCSPRPVQRAVRLIREHLEEDRLVILVGLFPQVTRTYRRFLDDHGRQSGDRLNRIVVIAGLRRLQFLRHSYPFEAEFTRPFHRIIRQYRQEEGIEHDLCMIPFFEFEKHYAPGEEAPVRIRELEKASELEEFTVPESVREEGVRYRHWKRNQPPFAIDELERERFRRILLSRFTNRDVLHFYNQTIDDRPTVQQALKEGLGALRENPNYLSERRSRYQLHELVRSLSQIHFFGSEEPRAVERIRSLLNREADGDLLPQTLDLLRSYGADLNFFQNTLGLAAEILTRLTEPLDVDLPALIFTTVASGIFSQDEDIKDYLLSPEDISYNRSVRRRVISHSVPIVEMVQETEAFQSLSPERQKRVTGLLEGAEPPVEYGLVQTALYLAFYIDRSRVENWERGRHIIRRRDILSLLPPLEEMLPRHISEQASRAVIERTEDLVRTEGTGLFNRLSRPSYAYIYLYNALSLASDLRYGLFQGGQNSLQNIRLLFGVERTNLLLEGIYDSDVSVREAVKICRKLRPLAAALRHHPENPDSLTFLNVERPGTWHLALDRETPASHYLLVGDFVNSVKFWRNLKENQPEETDRCYVLVGPDYPLLIKETSLAYTDYLRQQVGTFRSDQQPVGRYMLMPARALLEEAPPPPEPVLLSYRNKPAGLFINAWLTLFDL